MVRNTSRLSPYETLRDDEHLGSTRKPMIRLEQRTNTQMIDLVHMVSRQRQLNSDFSVATLLTTMAYLMSDKPRSFILCDKHS